MAYGSSKEKRPSAVTVRERAAGVPVGPPIRRAVLLAKSGASGFAQIDLVGDDLEVLGVVGQQRDAMDVGSGGDREVQRSPPWGSTTLRDHRVQPPALARRDSIEWQRVEVVLDGAETAHPQSACFLVAGDEHPEVELCQRDDADGRVLVWSPLGRDQDRGIEQDRHSGGGPGVCELPAKHLEILL